MKPRREERSIRVWRERILGRWPNKAVLVTAARLRICLN